MTKKEYEAYCLRDAKDVLKKIYAKYPTGGPLHIVLDDGNFETSHIVWCLAHIAEDSLLDEDLDMFERIATDLLELPYNKRFKIWQQQ